VGQQLDLGTLHPSGVGLSFDTAVTYDGEELGVVNAASKDVLVSKCPPLVSGSPSISLTYSCKMLYTGITRGL